MIALREAAGRAAGFTVATFESDFRRAVRGGEAWPDPKCLVRALTGYFSLAYGPEQCRERVAYLAESVADELAEERVIAPRAVANVRRRFERAIAAEYGNI